MITYIIVIRLLLMRFHVMKYVPRWSNSSLTKFGHFMWSVLIFRDLMWFGGITKDLGDLMLFLWSHVSRIVQMWFRMIRNNHKLPIVIRHLLMWYNAMDYVIQWSNRSHMKFGHFMWCVIISRDLILFDMNITDLGDLMWLFWSQVSPK